MTVERRENHVEAARSHLKNSGKISRTIAERINHVIIDHLDAGKLAEVSADLAQDHSVDVRAIGVHALGLLREHGEPHHKHVVNALTSPDRRLKAEAAGALRLIAPHLTAIPHVDWALTQLALHRGPTGAAFDNAITALERRRAELTHTKP